MAGSDVDVAQGLANLAQFFLLDAQGNARPPNGVPYRMFTGMGV